MGLAARAIEKEGIPTISLSISRDITEKIPPPRSVFMKFPFGHALGEPGNANQQFAILHLAFRHLFNAKIPGEILDSGLRWRRETYDPPNWEEFKTLAPQLIN